MNSAKEENKQALQIMTENVENYINSNDFTENQIKFIKRITSDFSLHTVTEICKKCKITRTTYYLWMEQPKFRDALKYIDEEQMDYFNTRALQMIEDGDSGMLRFLMEKKGKKLKLPEYIDAPQASSIEVKIINDTPKKGGIFSESQPE